MTEMHYITTAAYDDPTGLAWHIAVTDDGRVVAHAVGQGAGDDLALPYFCAEADPALLCTFLRDASAELMERGETLIAAHLRGLNA